MTGKIQTRVSSKQDDGTVHFVFHLKNESGKEKTFHFNTGQRFDFIIKDSQGKKIKQYSKGRIFTQALGEEKVKKGEELTYKAKIADLPKGKYTVTFWLTAQKEDLKASRTFEVE
ncbi:BsuPI-related putative proteinase inhibitor [Virgibacillus halophilus]|uniref:Intracellular proteinase inhibitor BsuPI domain-containing protein n=1 Tax=Tigheibacillus halophilus TaxID=361280 RepID=A0ABU5C837_9BACI|nr:BsuPI-related putative proteinase inhibitor [Virgibacillus halophilus]